MVSAGPRSTSIGQPERDDTMAPDKSFPGASIDYDDVRTKSSSEGPIKRGMNNPVCVAAKGKNDPRVSRGAAGFDTMLGLRLPKLAHLFGTYHVSDSGS